MMAGPRWEQVKELFQAALDQEPHGRATFVRDACGEDSELRAEVESLLAAHERAGSFAERPATESAAGARERESERVLRIGDSFGPYQILEWLGAGGMGEVYRARDTKLNREIALKVLPDLFAFDPDRLVRFRREAQVLAALNHPNIAAIYGLEETVGRQALVLELVDGPTLANRIAQGPIPIDEALPFARQIAEALEAAHEHGIVHRDLKPANIKLRSDGAVKVLDFGLAKAFAPAPADARDLRESPTVMVDGTREGVILGTVAYMSPEQARGKAVDKRTDIWAFGCVLYEMLAGKPAFTGDDETETIAAIVRDEPAWNMLPPETPPRLLNLLRRCLEKDPQQRVRDIGDARLVMEGAFDTPTGPDVLGPAPASRPAWRRFATYAAALLLGAVATDLVVRDRMRGESRQVERFLIPLDVDESFNFVNRHLVALAPDGRHIVYQANQGLYLRRVDQLQATLISGSEAGGGRSPFFSPDGQQVGFWAGGQLKRVGVLGAAPVTLCSTAIPWGASWEADNNILFGQGPAGISRVPSTGGTAEAIIKVAEGELAQSPQLLPGGEWVLFTLLPKGALSWNAAQIVAHSLRTGERRVLIREGHDGRYDGSGHLLYVLNGALLAASFDAKALSVTGGATSIVESVASAERETGAAHFSVTPNGALVYVPSLARAEHTLVFMDRQGREEAIGAPARAYLYPRISPDGTRVAVYVRDQQNDIWVWDLARQTLTRLTADPGLDRPPVWTPDSRRIAYSSTRDTGGLFWQAADGTGSVERLTENATQYPTSFSPDGTHLLFWGASGIGVLALQSGPPVVPLIRSGFAERNAEVSADGRWLAYQSDESGQFEVYVRPFPDVDSGRWQVSTSGGERPLWAHRGRELFYVAPGGLMSVAIEPAPSFRAGNPEKLVEKRYFFGDGQFQSRMYDISPDDRRFVFLKDAQRTDTRTPSQLVLVLNWTEELKQRVPTQR